MLIVSSIFIDSFKVATLSQLKSRQQRIKIELKEKYTIEKPDKPIDESKYLLAPEKQKKDASEKEKLEYDKLKKEFDDKIANIKDEHKKAMEVYNKTYHQYKRSQKALDLKEKRDYRINSKLKKELKNEIKDYQLSVNEFTLTTIFRFLGSIILLIGCFGILMWGETYERLGVLIVLGFGLKTIIGL